jgi:cytochrome c
MTAKSRQRFWTVLTMTWSLTILAVLLCPHPGITEAPTRGNSQNGKGLFEKRCTGCHTLTTNKEGPRLGGVFGRRAGAVSDFAYSDEMKAANLTWDEATLDKWLTNTDAVIRNNDMAFRVASPQERADIIEYLRVSSGK